MQAKNARTSIDSGRPCFTWPKATMRPNPSQVATQIRPSSLRKRIDKSGHKDRPGCISSCSPELITRVDMMSVIAGSSPFGECGPFRHAPTKSSSRTSSQPDSCPGTPHFIGIAVRILRRHAERPASLAHAYVCELLKPILNSPPVAAARRAGCLRCGSTRLPEAYPLWGWPGILSPFRRPQLP
jgi:hypothetical protein